MIEVVVFAVFWLVIALAVVGKAKKTVNNRPGMDHPTSINKSRTKQKDLNKSGSGRTKPTIAMDGHRIPKAKDVTCEGQYGHDHGNTGPRYIVHEEPTEGYCILNGKKVALKDCWKY